MSGKAKPKKTETGSKSPPAESAEYQAFEKLVKQVVSVPKDELDRRDAERARKKRTS